MSGVIPPYDLPPDDEDPEENEQADAYTAAARVARQQSKETRMRAALQHLASPNRGARPTGQDALDMAAYARQALEEIDGT